MGLWAGRPTHGLHYRHEVRTEVSLPLVLCFGLRFADQKTALGFCSENPRPHQRCASLAVGMPESHALARAESDAVVSCAEALFAYVAEHALNLYAGVLLRSEENFTRAQVSRAAAPFDQCVAPALIEMQ